MWVSEKRLYLDAEGNVTEGPGKVSLLVGAGGSIPLEQAQALGLVDAEGKALGPKSNKAKAPGANKRADE